MPCYITQIIISLILLKYYQNIDLCLWGSVETIEVFFIIVKLENFIELHKTLLSISLLEAEGLFSQTFTTQELTGSVESFETLGKSKKTHGAGKMTSCGYFFESY